MRAVVTNHKLVSLRLDNGDNVEDDRKYVVVTKSFLADGKDGYDCLKGHCELLMDVSTYLVLCVLLFVSFTLFRNSERLRDSAVLARAVGAHDGECAVAVATPADCIYALY